MAHSFGQQRFATPANGSRRGKPLLYDVFFAPPYTTIIFLLF